MKAKAVVEGLFVALNILVAFIGSLVVACMVRNSLADPESTVPISLIISLGTVGMGCLSLLANAALYTLYREVDR